VILKLLLLVCAAGSRQEPSPMKTRALGLIEALNSGDQKTLGDFLQKNLAPEVLKDHSASQLATAFLSTAHLTGKLKFVKDLATKGSETVFQVANENKQDFRFQVVFQAADPYLMLGLRITPINAKPVKSYTAWKDLTDLAGQIRDYEQLPALGIGVVAGDHIQVAVSGVRRIGGTSNVEADDRWLIGSCTKSMTATMIACLVDKGLLKWDLTLGEALPDVPMRDEAKGITLLQLLQHRSGLPQDQTMDDAFVARVVGDAKAPFDVRERYVRDVLQREPLAKPGAEMHYSNAGYAIVGHIAERYAKTTYEDLMQTLLFNPLKMETARLATPGSPGTPGAPDVAGQKPEIMGHSLGDKGLRPNILNDSGLTAMIAPAGIGVSMSLPDLARYAQFHMQGLAGKVRLMRPETFAVLHAYPKGGNYACGWVLDSKTAATPFETHNGSDGTFFADIALFPRDNLALVAATNCAPITNPAPTMQAILAAYARQASH